MALILGSTARAGSTLVARRKVSPARARSLRRVECRVPGRVHHLEPPELPAPDGGRRAMLSGEIEVAALPRALAARCGFLLTSHAGWILL